MPGTDTRAREVFGTRFQNPVLLASGTAGFGRELDGTVDLDALGGIVTKAVSLEPRAGQPGAEGGRVPRRYAQQRRAGQSRARPGPSRRVALAPGPAPARPGPRQRGRFHRRGVCRGDPGPRRPRRYRAPSNSTSPVPTPRPAASSSVQSAESLQAVVAGCRRATRRPLVVKLSPVLPDLPLMAQAAREAGADGVTLVNTMPGMLCDERRTAEAWQWKRGGERPGAVPGRAPRHPAGGRPAAGLPHHRCGGDPDRRRGPAVSRRRVPCSWRSVPEGWRIPGCRAGSPGNWRRTMAEVILALDLPSSSAALRLLDRVPRVRWVKVGSVLMTREGARPAAGTSLPRTVDLPRPEVARYSQHGRGRGPSRIRPGSSHGHRSHVGRDEDAGGGQSRRRPWTWGWLGSPY